MVGREVEVGAVTNTLFKVYRTLEKEDEWSKKHGSKSWRRVSRP
jgi:hypothetical protein